MQLTFEGAAVDGGRMNVRDLAPSLIAFAALVGEAQHLLFPDDREISVQISAPRDGSFEVDLMVVTAPVTDDT